MKKIIVLLLVAVPLFAQQFGQVGTSGGQLFKINFDPRASGLGNAAASVVNNVSAVYTNVAGLEGVQKGDIAFTYSPWFADIHMVSIAGAYRLENIGVFALQATGFSTNEEITTIEMENGTGQTYSIQNMILGASFARHITEKLVIGAQVKYLRESYYDHSTSGLAFDLGTNYDLGFSGARLAMTLQNFGPDMDPLAGSYNDYSDGNNVKGFLRTPLPVTFRASFSLEPVITEAYRIRVIADLIHPNDNIEHYCLGSEVLFYNFIAVRGGLKLNYDDEKFAFGVGIKGSQFLGQDIRFDYSYEQFKILPSVQKLSLGIGF